MSTAALEVPAVECQVAEAHIRFAVLGIDLQSLQVGGPCFPEISFLSIGHSQISVNVPAFRCFRLEAKRLFIDFYRFVRLPCVDIGKAQIEISIRVLVIELDRPSVFRNCLIGVSFMVIGQTHQISHKCRPGFEFQGGFIVRQGRIIIPSVVECSAQIDTR